MRDRIAVAYGVCRGDKRQRRNEHLVSRTAKRHEQVEARVLAAVAHETNSALSAEIDWHLPIRDTVELRRRVVEDAHQEGAFIA